MAEEPGCRSLVSYPGLGVRHAYAMSGDEGQRIGRVTAREHNADEGFEDYRIRRSYSRGLERQRLGFLESACLLQHGGQHGAGGSTRAFAAEQIPQHRLCSIQIA